MLFIANLKNNAFETDISLFYYIFFYPKKREFLSYLILIDYHFQNHWKKINSSNVFFFQTIKILIIIIRKLRVRKDKGKGFVNVQVTWTRFHGCFVTWNEIHSNSKFEMVSETRSSHVVPWTQPVTSPKRGDEGRCLHDYMLCVQEFS